MVCRELGYLDEVEHVVVPGAFFGSGASAIHLDDLSCVGNETMLAQCPHSGISNHNCEHVEDAGVVCTGE